jgi:hypothetical protein
MRLPAPTSLEMSAMWMLATMSLGTFLRAVRNVECGDACLES